MSSPSVPPIYVTPDEVRRVLARDDRQRQYTAASMENTRMLEIIRDTQGQVNSALAGRYVVPFPQNKIPELVRSTTRNLAAYYADLSYRQGKDYDSQYDPIYLLGQQALKTLDKLAKGDMSLPDADGVDEDGNSITGSATVINPTRYPLLHGRRGHRYGDCW